MVANGSGKSELQNIGTARATAPATAPAIPIVRSVSNLRAIPPTTHGQRNRG
jgi:hypothetical protein